MESTERENRNAPETQDRSRGDRAGAARHWTTHHRLLERVAWGSAVFVAAITVGFLACGCGSEGDDASVAATDPGQTLVVARTASTGDQARAMRPAAPEPVSEALAAASEDSLPPDVAASTSDTLVFSGGSVEITAEGSPDVVGVTLADGVGRKQAFAYDPHADLWRVFYRVPVRPATDRLALSVTARNASNRWRRVWLFLSVQREGTVVQPDSGGRP